MVSNTPETLSLKKDKMFTIYSFFRKMDVT